jgi:hypothetical protein
MAVDSDRPNKVVNAGKYGVAVWNICGTADDKWSVAVDYTNRINNANPVIRAKLTGIPNVGHSAWNQGYDKDWRVDNMNLYEWMLQYSRGASTPPPPPPPAPAPEPEPEPAPVGNTPPYVNAGADAYLTLPSNSISLSAAYSDAEGWLQSSYWTKIDGPSQYSITSGNSPSPVISNLVSGTYIFRFTGTDNDGASSTDDITIIVSQGNSSQNTASTTATENTAIAGSWKIYPNPVNDRLGIEMTNSYNGEIKAQIIDHTGRLRQEFKINKNQPFINFHVLTNNLSTGTYMLHFQFGNRKETRKFLKL